MEDNFNEPPRLKNLRIIIRGIWIITITVLVLVWILTHVAN
ncbi:MAG: hypothetical protein ACLFPE_05720 [Bacteroidales bacterium]